MIIRKLNDVVRCVKDESQHFYKSILFVDVKGKIFRIFTLFKVVQIVDNFSKSVGFAYWYDMLDIIKNKVLKYGDL